MYRENSLQYVYHNVKKCSHVTVNSVMDLLEVKKSYIYGNNVLFKANTVVTATIITIIGATQTSELE